MRTTTLLTKGENCPFRKIVILVKLLLCEIKLNYYMAGSASGQDEANPVF